MLTLGPTAKEAEQMTYLNLWELVVLGIYFLALKDQ